MHKKNQAVAAQSPLAALIAWFRNRRATDEFSMLDADEARQIADDLKVSVTDLKLAATQSADELDLMRRMLLLHGLDRARIELELPMVARDLALTCAHCAEKSHCAHELDHGATARDADKFCPNAETMRALATM